MKLLLLLLFPLALFAQTLTVHDISGAQQTNYPMRIGYPFAIGDIADYPQVLIDGDTVHTQANVKTRWDDGSVKHAILSFIVPNINANATIQITFQNQTTGNETGYETESDMLGGGYDFDATIRYINLANDDSMDVSARAMVDSADFTYWLQGDVATSVIIADHSVERTFDVGFDTYRAIRPIFLATFWPSINRVQVRFISEISNTEAFEDQQYSLKLFTGNTSPALEYAQDSLTHYAGSRWTKQFWVDAEMPEMEIDYDISYLTQTYAVPNYDSTKTLSESAISTAYSEWTGADKDLYDAGNWTKYMPNTGGRPDIGPYPTWNVQWLYNGDHRLKDKAFGNADLAAAWPMHFREGDSSKWFDSALTVKGLGKVLSIRDRPTIRLTTLDYLYTDADDAINVVGAYSDGGWIPDAAHHPEPFSTCYLLSGDYWYLEELWFWASWTTGESNGAAVTNGEYGRGPTGAEGVITGQVRGQAWTLRTRINAANMSPDDSDEKDLWENLIDDALAAWEGKHNITGTSYYNNSCWQWGRDYIRASEGVPPLHYWDKGGSEFLQDPVNTSVTSEAASTWEQNFMMYSLGRAKELGYASDSLVAYLAYNINSVLTNNDYNPYLIEAYRTPTIKVSDSDYFQTWADEMTGYTSAAQTDSTFNTINDAQHGYCFIALTAVSYTANEENGNDAWNFMETNVLPASALDDNPKWAIVARDVTSTDTTPPTGTLNITETAITVTGISSDCATSHVAFATTRWDTVSDVTNYTGSSDINQAITTSEGNTYYAYWKATDDSSNTTFYSQNEDSIVVSSSGSGSSTNKHVLEIWGFEE